MTSVEITPRSMRLSHLRILATRVMVAVLVYGSLAVFIGAVYVAAVVGMGGILGFGAGNLGLSIMATALVAASFEPVRRRVQDWANWLAYGRRASPYEVLAELTDRLAEPEAAQGTLRRMARLMADGTGADQVAVWMRQANGLVLGAGWPQAPSVTRVDSLDQLSGLAQPVVHENEMVGALQVFKSGGKPITPVETRLIADLAGSAGLLLGNKRLNEALAAHAAELQASRRRLLQAQDSERLRLERDLHQGIQQEVVALNAQIRLLLQAAEAEIAEDIADLLSEISDDIRATVEEIRALARGLYPPLLQSEGLGAAVASRAQGSPIPVELRCEGIGRHPKSVELAVYFAVAEAMTNAIKHGHPSRIDISMSESKGFLRVEVEDDGVGFGLHQTGDGNGLVNIRDRVGAVGGDVDFVSPAGAGTVVAVRIPMLEGSGVPNLA